MGHFLLADNEFLIGGQAAARSALSRRGILVIGGAVCRPDAPSVVRTGVGVATSAPSPASRRCAATRRRAAMFLRFSPPLDRRWRTLGSCGHSRQVGNRTWPAPPPPPTEPETPQRPREAPSIGAIYFYSLNPKCLKLKAAPQQKHQRRRRRRPWQLHQWQLQRHRIFHAVPSIRNGCRGLVPLCKPLPRGGRAGGGVDFSVLYLDGILLLSLSRFLLRFLTHSLGRSN